MEKILQSKTLLVFGLLLICALFVITYKSVPFRQNEVYVQSTEVDEVLKSQDILFYRLVLNLNMKLLLGLFFLISIGSVYYMSDHTNGNGFESHCRKSTFFAFSFSKSL